MLIWREIVTNAVRHIGGQGTLSQIYDAVIVVADRDRPEEWQAIVRRELEHNSSDSQSFKGNHDLFYSAHGLGKGVWGLRELGDINQLACDLELPERIEIHTLRIIRDTQLAKHLKLLHKNCCQICGLSLQLAEDRAYSEAHHIKPLGMPHSGPDVASNIIVLCPNHHALLDYGAISLNRDDLREVRGHIIDEQFIRYHNNEIVLE